MLKGEMGMQNLVGKPEMIKPIKGSLDAKGNTITVTIPARSFVVLSF